MKRMKGKKGFSLIELVTAVVIIMILAMLSGPIYNSYSTKTKQAEGYTLLGTILSAQLAYYNEAGTYLYCKNSSSGFYQRTCYDEVLDIDARSCKYYTCFCVNDDGGNGLKGSRFSAYAEGIGVKPLTLVYRRWEGGATIY